MWNSTYTRCSHTVSTVKKSTAIMLLACVRRHSRRDGPRRTVGPSPLARRICFDGGRRDHHADALELADDPLIPPPWIFLGKPHDQCADGRRDRWSTRCSRRSPPLRDQEPVPVLQRRRCDDKRRPVDPWQQPACDRQEHPVSGPKRRLPDLAAPYRDLVGSTTISRSFDAVDRNCRNSSRRARWSTT
jgi:hypothetical protein